MVRLSLELTPLSLLRARTSARLLRLVPLLPNGTPVYLPNLPGDPPTTITDALKVLLDANRGLKPVPHIAATRIQSEDELLRRLDSWQSASSNAVAEVLIVGGDAQAHSIDVDAEAAHARRAGGPFRTSLDLLKSGVLQRSGVTHVGLCGHPEGIPVKGKPKIDRDVGIEILKEKIDFAAAGGIQPSVVTQFCFAADVTTCYIDQLRRAGIGAPVSVGVVGPASPSLLEHMAVHCGVAAPRGSKANAGTSPCQEPWPAGYVRELALWHSERGCEEGIQALHVYPFGGLGKTLGWLATDLIDDINARDQLHLEDCAEEKEWLRLREGLGASDSAYAAT